MINKKLAVLLVLLFFIAACSGGGSDQPIAVNYKKGYGGLKLDILKNNPPDEVLEKGRFSIAVKISNEGAYDIKGGLIMVVGINPAFTVVDNPASEIPPLEGKSFNAPDGAFYIEEFSARNFLVPPGVDEYKTKYWVEARYDYESTLNADICINPALLMIEESDDSCSVDEKMSFSGQGGPIAITQVEEVVGREETSTRVKFKFTVQNRGKGDLISPVVIEEVKVANRRLNCNVREIHAESIAQNKGVVECEFIEPNRGAYTTTLSATVSYIYRIVENDEFVIKKLGR